MSPIAAAALFAVFLLAIVALAVGVITYNAVVALRTRIDKAWGNVEVALRQRHDQLPALVDAVRDLMAFEQDVLEEVTRQRARYAPDAPVAEQGASSRIRSKRRPSHHWPGRPASPSRRTPTQASSTRSTTTPMPPATMPRPRRWPGNALSLS